MDPTRPDEAAITAQVIAVIAQVKRIPAARVGAESTFAELEIDSLDGVEIIAELEEVFDVSIPNEVAFEMRGVRQVVDGIEALLRGRPAGPSAS